MQKILFVDYACPEPYDEAALQTRGMGGTEATVVRVATSLSKHMPVQVSQHNRAKTSGLFGGPFGLFAHEDFSHVVVLRDAFVLPRIQKLWPNAKLYLWMHDMAGPQLYHCMSILREYKPTIITVSHFHQKYITEALWDNEFVSTGEFGFNRESVQMIYNPIDDDLSLDRTPIDKNKLVFFSSPHKGLTETLEHFRNVRNHDSAFRLYVANPGYFPSRGLDTVGCIQLGVLSHQEVLHHVRSALCLFYPNTVFPETFGLVLAEANAVGTRVVTHDLGAAREVLSHPDQLVDCHNKEAVLQKVLDYQKSPLPDVFCRPKFRQTQVTQAWLEMLK